MANNIRVLLIEDNPGDARIIRELLTDVGPNFILEYADLLSRGLERLSRIDDPIDALLLDLTLPDSYGLDTFIKVHTHAPRLPIIMLTGLIDEELAIQAMRSGAQDYLVKGQVDGNLLAHAIRYAIERCRVEEALRESENKYATLFESLSDSIVLFDNNSILECNGATLKMFGFEKKGDILQLKPQELSPPNQPDGTNSTAAWKKIIAEATNNGLRRSEWMHCRNDGQFFPAEILLSPISLRKKNVFQITIRDITERKKTEETLKRYNDFLENLSLTDGLTGIANRRRFDQCIDGEWRRAMRNKSGISLIMLDIDYFKAFNDSYGHIAGDDCLRKLARCLCETLRRPMDLAARYGGEEFACVLPETNIDGAICVTNNIRQKLYDLNIEHSYSQVSDRISVSIGVASLIPNMKQSYFDLMKSADDCLYSAKQNGRNQVKVYRV